MMRARNLHIIFVGLFFLVGCFDSTSHSEPAAPEIQPPEPLLTPTIQLQENFVVRGTERSGTRYIVILGDDVTDRASLSSEIVRRHGGQLGHVFRHVLNGFTVSLPNDAAAEAIRRNPLVQRVEMDVKAVAAEDNGGTQSPPPASLDRLDQRSSVLDGTFKYYQSGAGVHVFIIDSGIDGSHPGLAANLAPSYVGTWISPLDPWNDCRGHGTSVASVAASAQWGVSKQAALHPMQITDCSDGTFWYGDLAEAVDWVVTFAHDYGQWPAVINISLSATPLPWPAPSFEDAIRNAVAAGVPVVTSAGNDAADACDKTPNRMPEVITVGATNPYNDGVWSNSNYGACVDIWAPGEGVAVATAGGGSGTANGTSFASPIVAGIVALIQDDASVPDNKTRTVLMGGTTRNALNGLRPSDRNLLANSTYGQVRVEGPWVVSQQGFHTWNAQAYGGDHLYTYQWEIRFEGQSTWTTIAGATGTSYSRDVMWGEPDFSLRVLTTTAGEQVTGELYVENVIGCADPQGCSD